MILNQSKKWNSCFSSILPRVLLNIKSFIRNIIIMVLQRHVLLQLWFCLFTVDNKAQDICFFLLGSSPKHPICCCSGLSLNNKNQMWSTSQKYKKFSEWTIPLMTSVFYLTSWMTTASNIENSFYSARTLNSGWTEAFFFNRCKGFFSSVCSQTMTVFAKILLAEDL